MTFKVYREEFNGSHSIQIRSYVENEKLWGLTQTDGESDLFLFADIKFDETLKSIEILSTYRFGYGNALKPEFEESYNFVDETDLDVLRKMFPGYVVFTPYFYSVAGDYNRWIPFSHDIFRGENSYNRAVQLFERAA